MEHIEKLTETFPDEGKDIRINFQNVLTQSSLAPEQAWGVALSCAYAARNRELVDAVLAEARASEVGEAILSDAKAAAILMGMNNVFYRFRHIVDKDEYAQKPARLRMQRLARVTSNKANFELFCLAVSAINNCQSCVRSHEATVIEQGLSADQVHDAVRIAATMHAAAVALESR